MKANTAAFKKEGPRKPTTYDWIRQSTSNVRMAPVVWGIRIQPTFALVRVVRGD